MLASASSKERQYIENGFRYFRFNVNQESDGITEFLIGMKLLKLIWRIFQKVELNSNASELDLEFGNTVNVSR